MKQNFQIFQYNISNLQLDTNLVHNIVTDYFKLLKNQGSHQFISQVKILYKNISTPITLHQYHSISEVDYKELVETILDSWLNIERYLDRELIATDIIISYKPIEQKEIIPFSKFSTTYPWNIDYVLIGLLNGDTPLEEIVQDTWSKYSVEVLPLLINKDTLVKIFQIYYYSVFVNVSRETTVLTQFCIKSDIVKEISDIYEYKVSDHLEILELFLEFFNNFWETREIIDISEIIFRYKIITKDSGLPNQTDNIISWFNEKNSRKFKLSSSKELNKLILDIKINKPLKDIKNIKTNIKKILILLETKLIRIINSYIQNITILVNKLLLSKFKPYPIINRLINSSKIKKLTHSGNKTINIYSLIRTLLKTNNKLKSNSLIKKRTYSSIIDSNRQHDFKLNILTKDLSTKNINNLVKKYFISLLSIYSLNCVFKTEILFYTKYGGIIKLPDNLKHNLIEEGEWKLTVLIENWLIYNNIQNIIKIKNLTTIVFRYTWNYDPNILESSLNPLFFIKILNFNKIINNITSHLQFWKNSKVNKEPTNLQEYKERYILTHWLTAEYLEYLVENYFDNLRFEFCQDENITVTTKVYIKKYSCEEQILCLTMAHSLTDLSKTELYNLLWLNLRYILSKDLNIKIEDHIESLKFKCKININENTDLLESSFNPLLLINIILKKLSVYNEKRSYSTKINNSKMKNYKVNVQNKMLTPYLLKLVLKRYYNRLFKNYSKDYKFNTKIYLITNLGECISIPLDKIIYLKKKELISIINNRLITYILIKHIKILEIYNTNPNNTKLLESSFNPLILLKSIKKELSSNFEIKKSSSSKITESKNNYNEYKLNIIHSGKDSTNLDYLVNKYFIYLINKYSLDYVFNTKIILYTKDGKELSLPINLTHTITESCKLKLRELLEEWTVMYMIDEELKIFLEYKNLTNIVFRYTRKCETNNKKLNKNVLENSFNSLLFIKKIYNVLNKYKVNIILYIIIISLIKWWGLNEQELLVSNNIIPIFFIRKININMKNIYSNIKNIFTNIKFLINRASPVEIPLPSSPPLSPIDKPLPSFPVEKPINTPIEFINIDKILQVILVLLLMYWLKQILSFYELAYLSLIISYIKNNYMSKEEIINEIKKLDLTKIEPVKITGTEHSSDLDWKLAFKDLVEKYNELVTILEDDEKIAEELLYIVSSNFEGSFIPLLIIKNKTINKTIEKIYIKINNIYKKIINKILNILDRMSFKELLIVWTIISIIIKLIVTLYLGLEHYPLVNWMNSESLELAINNSINNNDMEIDDGLSSQDLEDLMIKEDVNLSESESESESNNTDDANIRDFERVDWSFEKIADQTISEYINGEISTSELTRIRDNWRIIQIEINENSISRDLTPEESRVLIIIDLVTGRLTTGDIQYIVENGHGNWLSRGDTNFIPIIFTIFNSKKILNIIRRIKNNIVILLERIKDNIVISILIMWAIFNWNEVDNQMMEIYKCIIPFYIFNSKKLDKNKLQKLIKKFKNIINKKLKIINFKDNVVQIIITWAIINWLLICYINLDGLNLTNNIISNFNLIQNINDFINSITTSNPLSICSPSIIPSEEKIEIVIVSNAEIKSMTDSMQSVSLLGLLLKNKTKESSEKINKLDIKHENKLLLTEENENLLDIVNKNEDLINDSLTEDTVLDIKQHKPSEMISKILELEGTKYVFLTYNRYLATNKSSDINEDLIKSDPIFEEAWFSEFLKNMNRLPSFRKEEIRKRFTLSDVKTDDDKGLLESLWYDCEDLVEDVDFLLELEDFFNLSFVPIFISIINNKYSENIKLKINKIKQHLKLFKTLIYKIFKLYLILIFIAYILYHFEIININLLESIDSNLNSLSIENLNSCSFLICCKNLFNKIKNKIIKNGENSNNINPVIETNSSLDNVNLVIESNSNLETIYYYISTVNWSMYYISVPDLFTPTDWAQEIFNNQERDTENNLRSEETRWFDSDSETNTIRFETILESKFPFIILMWNSKIFKLIRLPLLMFVINLLKSNIDILCNLLPLYQIFKNYLQTIFNDFSNRYYKLIIKYCKSNLGSEDSVNEVESNNNDSENWEKYWKDLTEKFYRRAVEKGINPYTIFPESRDELEETTRLLGIKRDAELDDELTHNRKWDNSLNNNENPWTKLDPIESKRLTQLRILRDTEIQKDLEIKDLNNLNNNSTDSIKTIKITIGNDIKKGLDIETTTLNSETTTLNNEKVENLNIPSNSRTNWTKKLTKWLIKSLVKDEPNSSKWWD